ncbi:MAG TPA: asparagine synthase (glutamine-hydrolyzing) [Solirubrobacteraceae bacterium]|nr:asparagine synthase (glutamine-hydrolyzing) [Solirubrobacteraceae bacterium]
MCGIAGTVGGAPPDDGVLTAMAAAMAHRGPDGQGVWRDACAGLAFRRLAIIDLDERSNQPLHLGPLHLVFNGEIYNYRELRDELRGLGHAFVTEGDGEVLLHAWDAWGERALDRVNGMFAFAVWHDEHRSLTLAADPFGEKPLYWTQDGERLVFGSDVRAILEAAPHRGGVRESVLAAYLGLGQMPRVDESFFADVRRLPAAHVLRFAGGRVEVERYWTPRRVAVPGDYAEAVRVLRAELVDSIRLRLRSDVPVGTSLSGGVDSSAIVCLSAELAGDHRRHAFTARFRGYERDEWPYAQAVAAAAGVVEHHPVEPTPAQLLDDLDALVRDQEEPFGSLSIYAQWRVMKAAREAGVTVLLDGQGADELFGGYDGVGGWATRSLGPRAIARAVAAGGDGRGELARAVGAELLPAALRRRHRLGLCSPYVSPAVAAEAVRRETPRGPGAAGSHPLRRELLRQAFHTSLPELLRYADRDSMAHSREARLPFLDRRIAELALSLPPQFLQRGGVRKAILRDAVRDSVPDVVLARRDKVGFEPPQTAWLHDGAVRARIAEVVLDPAARGGALYERAALEADVRAGRWRDPKAVWRVFNLELWLAAVDAGLRSAVAAA